MHHGEGLLTGRLEQKEQKSIGINLCALLRFIYCEHNLRKGKLKSHKLTCYNFDLQFQLALPQDDKGSNDELEHSQAKESGQQTLSVLKLLL